MLERITHSTELQFQPRVIMDHEKPEAVPSQTFGSSGERNMSVHESELHYDRAPSIEELAQIKEKRERRGESVW